MGNAPEGVYIIAYFRHEPGSEKMSVLSVMLHLWLQLNLAPLHRRGTQFLEKNEVGNAFFDFDFLTNLSHFPEICFKPGPRPPCILLCIHICPNLTVEN